MEIDIKLAFKKVNKDSSILNKCISKYTKSKYFHTEIVLGDKWISSDPNEGVYIKEIKSYNKDEWDFVIFENISISERDFNIIIDYIKKQDDKKYDFLGILLSQFIPFSFHNRNRYFCSELCTKILQLFLIEEVLDLIPNNTSPGDLAKIFNMEK